MTVIDENKKLYLGLDLSTQQLKCTLINEEHHITYEEAVHFDRDLPEFGTKYGAIVNDDVVTSPTLMWVKALDLLLTRLKKTGLMPLVQGISGAGQQHGSVYWNKEGINQLNHLDAKRSLFQQLENGFSITQSPIWQDASTTQECRHLEKSVGGPEQLASLTGSKAYERFTGNQIAKIYHHNREAYNQTEYIGLVSSMLATLLLGQFSPVDTAEGSGTNMMNIRTHKWDEKLLYECGGDALKEKLAKEPVEGSTVLGNINPYYVERYGFKPECKIVSFTGDNSATLVSMNLLEGDCVVSLGTSDTVLVYLKKDAAATTESHLMVHPIDSEGFMGMLCYKNGSLTREHIRNIYADGSWETFNSIITKNEAMFDDCLGFYYWMQEIIPFAKGIYRFQKGTLVNEFDDKQVNVKAIVESQFMSMKIRLERMGGHMKRVLASGGAASNPILLQLLSDIFGLPVYRQKGMNGASLGGALLAKYAIQDKSFNDMMAEFPSTGLDLICQPDMTKTEKYKQCENQFIKLERSIIDTL
ncbi:Xylulose kinase [Choanephora cucurbitarum]|uniref:Xylulose kinase n=1 Tax=Choanephora cucurbitarum TaxID=101091 RepID=A0A1C7NIQ3_9FUNG|nr:Xylulose kinase [Choanephora cucurbitarum]